MQAGLLNRVAGVGGEFTAHDAMIGGQWFRWRVCD